MVMCPACGYENDARDYLELYTSRGYDKSWLKCKKCKSYFMGSNFDEKAEEENTLINSSRSVEVGERVNVFKQRMFNFILDEIKKINSTAKNILDIGSSYGGFLLNARERGYKVLGTEIAMPAVEYMRKKGIEAYHQFSVSEMTEERQYDVITAIDCNMYWPRQAEELAEIRKRLSANGIFVMRVVDKSWAVKIGLMLRKILPGAGNKIIKRAVNDHRFSMPVQSLKKLLKQSGFNIVDTSIKGAVHSYDTSFSVKASFLIGSFIYTVTGLFIAPGMVIIMKKA